MILPASGNGLFPQVPPFNMIHSQHKNPHHRHHKGKCQGRSAFFAPEGLLKTRTALEMIRSAF